MLALLFRQRAKMIASEAGCEYRWFQVSCESHFLYAAEVADGGRE